MSKEELVAKLQQLKELLTIDGINARKLAREEIEKLLSQLRKEEKNNRR